MTTAYTSLLGLALPVTGELSGTWGDTVNNSITSLLDSAVAGTTTLSVDADVTLTTTTGAANTSREAILLWTAGGTVTRTITAPAQSKVYVVINASSSTQSIVLRGAGPTTGITIIKGESAVCAWNGSDFVKVSSISGTGAFTDLSYTGTLTGGTGIVNLGSGQFYKDASGNVGIGTTSIIRFGFVSLASSSTTTNQLVLADTNAYSASPQAQINFAIKYNAGGTYRDAGFIRGVKENATDGNSASYLSFATNGNAAAAVERLRIDSSGNVGVGTSTPVGNVDVFGNSGGGAGTVVPISITVGDTSTGNAWPGDGTLSTVFNYYSGDGTNTGVRWRHGVGETIASGQYSAWKLQYRSAGGAINSYTGFSDAISVDFSGNTTLGATTTSALTVSGYMSVGGAAASTTGLKVVSAALTGTAQDGIQSAPVATSAATAQIRAFTAIPGTAAAAFTCAAAYGFRAYDASTGAASTITNLYGVYVNDLTQGTNNYGITSIVTSGTNKFNLYASGTAQNYFAGNVGIGTNAPADALDVVGNVYVDSLSTANNAEKNSLFFGGASTVGTQLAAITGYRGSSVSEGALLFKTLTGSVLAEKMRIDPSGNVQVQAGAVMPYAPTPASISTTATLTNANIQGQIINTTGTSYTVTMPLGTTLETLATWVTTNIAYDFYVINTASGTITMAVNTGVTSLGGLTIATGVSAQFRIRRTAVNTFVLYRLG